MAGIKSIILITLLVSIITVSRVETRQIDGRDITRNDDNIDGLFESITNITGNLLCHFHHHNGTFGAPNVTMPGIPLMPGIPTNGTAPPPFPNAVVELKCGANLTLATAITDIEGLFTMMINPLQAILSTILSDCRLTVSTPLTACNPTANPPPRGNLVSALQFIEHIFQGLLKIAIVIPVGFDIRVGG